jgi:tetratricopeptide (TPR) repeat protein
VIAFLLAAWLQAPGKVVAEWRELLELDLPAAVAHDGPALVGPGGELEKDGEALALVARALFETDGLEAARRVIDAADPAPETAVYVDLERARLMIEDDALEAAIDFLVTDPETDTLRYPDRPRCWLLVGRAHARAGELERAAPYLERFLAMAPMDREAPSALYVLSQRALRAGDGATAQQLAQRARQVGQWHAYYRVRRLQVREAPDEPLPRLGLAQLWLNAGQPEQAVRELDLLLELAPDFCPAWFHLGEARRLQQDLDAALAAYDRAVACDEDEVLARHNRAVIARMQGRTEAARADLEWIVSSAHADDPRVLNAHLELARLLLAAGETSAAEERYARYRQLGGKGELRE